jgi:hypothetical protein
MPNCGSFVVTGLKREVGRRATFKDSDLFVVDGGDGQCFAGELAGGSLPLFFLHEIEDHCVRVTGSPTKDSSSSRERESSLCGQR